MRVRVRVRVEVRFQQAEDGLLPQREAEDVAQVHPLPTAKEARVRLRLQPSGRRNARAVEALHPGRDGLGDHLLLALLAEQVGDDARHPLREAHALDLLVLHVAALILVILAIATGINLIFITMRPETISVLNVMMGDIMLIPLLLALAKICFNKGRQALEPRSTAGVSEE